MQIRRIRLQRFRGFEAATITATGDVAIVGEPRAGRTDLITAFRRVLHPRSTVARVNPLDVYRPSTPDALMTEIEVSLVDLGSDLEQLLDQHLEALDPDTGELTTGPDVVLGVRLCYRLRYDPDTDIGEHWVDWVGESDPVNGIFARARRVEREALPVLWINREPPLQVRAEGTFRALMEDGAPEALSQSLEALGVAVESAASSFTTAPVMTEVIGEVLKSGVGDILGIDDASDVTLVADDGSLSGLLRTLQPAINLDPAGMLPLTSHGSTSIGVFSAAEAVAAASRTGSGLVVFADDFGDDLDNAASEHLALLLTQSASQVWLSTRRPAPLRAFVPENVLRLTLRDGQRAQHRLAPTTDRKARRARRDLLPQLLDAMTSRCVVLVEGPHDLEGLNALAWRLARRGNPDGMLAGRGLRIVAAPGETGGKDVLPVLATLARDLGFEVRAVMDNDKPGENDKAFGTMDALTEQLVVLPERTAIERALVVGIDPKALRGAITRLASAYTFNFDVDSCGDADLADSFIAHKVLKTKPGLHAPWVASLPPKVDPPLAVAVLEALQDGELGRVDIEDWDDII